MGRLYLSDVHSSLWSLASAVLVASAHNVMRYPDLHTSFMQILALGFLVGCTFAPDLKTFAG